MEHLPRRLSGWSHCWFQRAHPCLTVLFKGSLLSQEVQGLPSHFADASLHVRGALPKALQSSVTQSGYSLALESPPVAGGGWSLSRSLLWVWETGFVLLASFPENLDVFGGAEFWGEYYFSINPFSFSCKISCRLPWFSPELLLPFAIKGGQAARQTL